MSNKKQELFTLREHLCSISVLLLIFLVLCFTVLALFVIVLCLMSNVAHVSGLSIRFSLTFFFLFFPFHVIQQFKKRTLNPENNSMWTGR